MVKKLVYDIFATLNALTLLGMWLCGFSTTLSPVDFPDASYIGMVFPAFLAVNVAFLIFWLVFKRKVLLVSVLGMIPSFSYIRTYCPLNLPSDPPEGCIKILSYNTECFGLQPVDSTNEIVQYIRASGSDIVCLQESNADSLRCLELFGDLYSYVNHYNSGGNCSAILSRFPILSNKHIEFPSTRNHATAYDVDLGTDTLCVIVCHLESYQLSDEDKTEYKQMVRHPKEEANKGRFTQLTAKLKTANIKRAEQVDSVLAYIDRNAGKSIVCCGDLNAPSLSSTHHRLTQVLDDAYTSSGNGPGISYNRSGMYFRIDNILVSPDIACYGAKVDAYSTVSDHFPIFSYIKIGGK